MATQTGPKSRRATSTVRRCALAVLLLGAAAYGLETVLAEDSWGSMLVLHTPQGPFLLLPILVGLWSWRRSDRPSLWMSVAAAAVGLHLCAPSWRGALPRANGERPVRVITFNLQGGLGGSEPIAALLRREHPDLVAFEEASFLGDRSADSQRVIEALPGFHWYREANQAIASRWPITKRWAADFKVPTHTWAIFAEVELNGRALLFGSAHLNPIHADRFLSTEIAGLPDHMRTTGRIRERQATELLHELDKVETSTPVILCGDFNGPPRGVVYSTLTQHLQDAFRESGAGLGWTIPSSFPVMRIDYVFLSPGSEAVHSQVLPNAGSDHRAVLAEVLP